MEACSVPRIYLQSCGGQDRIRKYRQSPITHTNHEDGLTSAGSIRFATSIGSSQWLTYHATGSEDVRRHVNVKLSVCQGCLSRQISMSRHMFPIPDRKTLQYLCGNPLFYDSCCSGVCAAMPSSTTAAQRPRQQASPAAGLTRHKQSAACSQQ